MMKSLWKNIDMLNLCFLTDELDKAMNAAKSIRVRFFSDVERYKAKHLLRMANAMKLESIEEENYYKSQAKEEFMKDNKTRSITELREEYKHVKD